MADWQKLLHERGIRTLQQLVEKFGEDYRLYMERVPALDPVTGSLRLLKGDKDELRKN